MPTMTEVLSDALELCHTDRAALAHQLLLSLEPGDLEEDVDSEWANVIRRRLQEIRSGQIQLSDWDDALVRMRRKLRPVQS